MHQGQAFVRQIVVQVIVSPGDGSCSASVAAWPINCDTMNRGRPIRSLVIAVAPVLRRSWDVACGSPKAAITLAIARDSDLRSSGA